MTLSNPLHPLTTTPVTTHLSSRCQLWLENKGSLSNQIRNACHEFSVQVLQQAILGTWPLDNTEKLHFKENQTLIKRCVLLQADGDAWVYAESYFPEPLFSEHFTCLNNGSLGDILFNTPQCTRFQMQTFDYTPCLKTHPVLHKIPSHLLLGRRSWFRFHQHPVMIDEVFLPTHPLYQT